jgi:hypothetical protein
VRAVAAYPYRARGIGRTTPRLPILPARFVAAKGGPFARAGGRAQRIGRTHGVAGRVRGRQEGRVRPLLKSALAGCVPSVAHGRHGKPGTGRPSFQVMIEY